MTKLHGFYFDGQSSNRLEAVCTISEQSNFEIRDQADGRLLACFPAKSVTISSRLGNTPRVLTFAGRSTFVTEENATVDQLDKRYRKWSLSRFVYLLENRKRFVFVSVCLILGIAWGAVKYGLPFSAKIIAFSLPDSVMTYASQYTLDILDESFLEETKLEPETRQRLIQQFGPLLFAHESYPLRVLFRSGELIGPNAFALPDGTIILTDAMVKLAHNDNELISVLAHEIGHVVYRHGLRRIVQGSLLGFLVMALTGDVSNATEIFVGLPVLLTELSYSREFELEADNYALQYLVGHQISPNHFSSIMRRITDSQPGAGENNANKLTDYLSTHPNLAERLLPFESIER